MAGSHCHTSRAPLTFSPSSEKQTMEFNLQVRANFKKTVRARMGEWRACGLMQRGLTVYQVSGRRWRCSTPLLTTLILM